MISLTPPFITANGLTLLPDHADPQQWYYMPMEPQIVVNDGVPSFSLIRFGRDDQNVEGGLLNFDVQLGPPAAQLDALLDDTAKKITDLLALPQPARRPAPVPVDDGSVKLVLLDTQTGDAAGQSSLVERLIHEAKPSLYGSEQVAFSAKLDVLGATLMDKVLDGAIEPIGVVYGLTFTALRPAFSVTLNIDWNLLKTHLDQRFQVDAIFVSSDVEKVLDELHEQRIIDLKDIDFVPDAEASKGMIADHDKALATAYDMITDAFFTAAFPTEVPPDGWDKAAGFVTQLGRAAVTGGMSLFGSVRYTSLDQTTIVDKKLNLSLTQQTAVTRTLWPQGHLTSIGALISASGRPRTDFVRSVSLNDPWFTRRRVKVVAQQDFSQGFTDGATVNLSYGGATTGVRLDRNNPSGDVDWPSVVTADGQALQPVSATTTFHLNTLAHYRLPAQVTATTEVDTEVLDVRLSDALALMPLSIRAEAVPWAHWSAIDVELNYADPANGLGVTDIVQLTANSTAFLYSIPVMPGGQATVNYVARYRGIGREDVAVPGSTDSYDITATNPFPTQRDVMVLANVDWTTVSTVLADLSYTDQAHNISQQASYVFTRDDNTRQTFAIDLADPAELRVSYDVTFLYTDGHQARVPSSSTGLKTLILYSGMPAHRSILVRFDQHAADAAGVSDTVVELATPGAEANPTRFEFRAGSLTTASWEFDFSTSSNYRWRASYTQTNGLVRTLDWADGPGDTLLISGA